MSNGAQRDGSGDDRLYRTVFVCELVQTSSLSIGGSDDGGLGDMPMLRDANGDLVIRGASIAGALVSTAKVVFGSVSSRISRGIAEPDAVATDARDMAGAGGAAERGGSDESGMPSSWTFDHASIIPADNRYPVTELRPGSPHRQDTRTAADAGLHDIEVLPPQGQTWRFLLDVDLTSPAFAAKEAVRDDLVAAYALREWKHGRCWLGRKTARGLGWMRLAKCDVYRLRVAHVDHWPDSTESDRLETLHKLGVAPTLIDDLIQEGGAVERTPLRRYVRWTGTARAGEYRPSGDGVGYGLDSLQIGGHGSDYMTPGEFGGDHFVQSADIAEQALADIKPDMALAMVRRLGKNNQSVLEPFIPGTSLAGSFRHWLSRTRRASKETIWDPVAQTDYVAAESAKGVSTTLPALDSVELLLGTRRGQGRKTQRQASALLVREAYLAESERDGWLVTCREHDAIDPFRQKSVPGAKFNRYSLLRGAFEWEFVLELDVDRDPEEWQQLVGFVESFLVEAAAARVAVGGGEMRGHGHLHFSVGRREEALAGDAGWRAFKERGQA